MVARRVAEWKAGEALRALDSGNAAAFGPVTVTPVGIQYGNQLTRWEDVGGFAVRHGGLLWDDAKGRLSGEVMLADVPFSDALCAVVATRLAGRDYDSMGSAQGRRHGLFSITARTRIPGTFKYQRHLFLGVVPTVLLLFGLLYAPNFTRNRIADRSDHREETPPAVPSQLAWIDDAARALKSPSQLASALACPRTSLPTGTYLVSADDKSTMS